MKVVTAFASANNRLAWRSGQKPGTRRRASGFIRAFVGFFEK
jgi:hypothetical protein